MTPRALRERIAASWVAATGVGTAASFALAILVLAGAFIAVAVPRASLGYRTQVVQRILQAAPSQQTAVLGDANVSGLNQGYLSAGQLALAGRTLSGSLLHHGLPLAPVSSQWSGLAINAGVASGTAGPSAAHLGPPQLEILYRSGLGGNATLVAGSPPTRAQGHGPSAAFQVAVTAATAARLGLHVGSRFAAAGQAFVVSGIIRPRGAASSFWTVDPVAPVPQLTYLGPDSPPYLSSAAFAGAAELPELERRLQARQLQALWSFPLDLGHVSADQAAGLLRTARGVSYLPAAGNVGASLSATAGADALLTVSLSSGLVSVLQSFVATDAAVQRALSLMFVSLAVIGAVVVLLGARLVAEHRRGEFALMRARGASLRQVSAVAARGGAAAVLPAALLGVACAVLLTPGPASWLSVWLAAGVIGTALAGPPLLVAWQHRARRAAAPAALAPAARRRVSAARRWVADGAVAAAAVAGLVILRGQGLPPPGSVDLFTSLAPVLAAIPVALLVVRTYALVLRQLTKLAGRRRGVVMVVGLARGSSAAPTGTLPAFALILAFAVVAFAAMARGAVAQANVVASWQAVGADAVVAAPPTGPGLTAAARRLITGGPGVQRAATISVTTGTSRQGVSVPVAVVDPRRYAALAAGTPAPRFPAAALARPGGGAAPPSTVPVLVSAAGRAILGQGSELSVAGRELRLHIAGRLAGVAGVPAGSQLVVVPRWALGNRAPQPNVIAIAGPRLDPAALIRVVHRAMPGAQVTLRSRLLAAISGAPLPHGGYVTLAQGAAAAGAFSLLILLLMLVLSARSREVTLARLITMGLGRDQSRRITAVEGVPVILAAAVGGTVCALILVPLVGPAVDLAAFAGMPVSVQLRADPVTLAIAAGGLLLLMALTLSIQGALARRLGAGPTLRIGA
jgi:putative ABC transport system permease protein